MKSRFKKDIKVKLDPAGIIPVDWSNEQYPENARREHPLVYQDEESICFLLGSDPQQGVFGCGPKLEEALQDWEERYIHPEKYEKGKDNKEKPGRNSNAQERKINAMHSANTRRLQHLLAEF